MLENLTLLNKYILHVSRVVDFTIMSKVHFNSLQLSSTCIFEGLLLDMDMASD